MKLPESQFTDVINDILSAKVVDRQELRQLQNITLLSRSFLGEGKDAILQLIGRAGGGPASWVSLRGLAQQQLPDGLLGEIGGGFAIPVDPVHLTA
ncbi:hypothetical protein E5F05_02030 (plasmid) [Deinococcus metallilatus]|uniref:Uncharacterized protein n=1 Tax=Deinococcus metallilatus TaxID=1211322 RepID=A0ABR6MX58_9DEIO|nr:hypothetical protein [Deinococcus metallilatus]MBB5295826.1 hypothetical protein [Deinococcus metallilatus]QBY06748.1 hypothetical protein E5F05_02030 [Deinococcus metallilatus]